MNGIKVSVVVPVYNVEKYLEKCLESIVEQTYQNIEIILVDDGSTDKSGEILDRYAQKDNRITVVHKKNEGVSTARNIGIESASGEYVCFADADDYLMPDYVEYLLTLAVDNNADVAMTTDMFTTFHPEQVEKDNIVVRTPEEATIDILSYNMPIGVYCKIFKREFLGENIRFVPQIYIGEGFNFNTMAFQRANKVVEGHHRIYFYRRDNPTSATTKFKLEKWQNAIYAIENIHKDLIIHSEKIEFAWEYANWHTHCDAFNFLVMARCQEKYANFYKKWKKVVKNKAYTAFRVNIIPRERIRAVIMMFWPELMPWMISNRNKKYMK